MAASPAGLGRSGLRSRSATTAPRCSPRPGRASTLALACGRDRRRRGAGGTWSRFKACRKDTCGWIFYDHSRNRSSNWCSMTICGNRSKTAGYRRREGPTRVRSALLRRRARVRPGFAGVVVGGAPRGPSASRSETAVLIGAARRRRRSPGPERLAGGRPDPGGVTIGARGMVRRPGRGDPRPTRRSTRPCAPGSRASACRGPTPIVLFRESTVAGHFVSIAGVDGLAPYVRLTTGTSRVVLHPGPLRGPAACEERERSRTRPG